MVTPAQDVTALDAVSAALSSAKRHFRPLSYLYLSIWGFFSVFAVSSTAILVKWNVVQYAIALNQQSAAVRTIDEWYALQTQARQLFWSGAMVTGGWPITFAFLLLLSLAFVSCWGITHMATLRYVSSDGTISMSNAIEHAVFRLPRLAFPYLLTALIVSLILGWRLIAIRYGLLAFNDESTWSGMDVFGYAALALLVWLLACIFWMFLPHAVILREHPRAAWRVSVQALKSSTKVSMTIWGASTIALSAIAAILLSAGGALVLFVGASPALAWLIYVVAICASLSFTAWVPLVLLPVWNGFATRNDYNASVVVSEVAQMEPSMEEETWHDDGIAGTADDIFIPDTRSGGYAEFSDTPLVPAESGTIPDSTNTEPVGQNGSEETPADEAATGSIHRRAAPRLPRRS